MIAVRAGNFSGQDQSAAHLIVDTLDQITVEVAAAVAQAAARGYGGQRSA